jgi:4-amino-4-deoxy-L-arabinose transferase-like glycosyltransferase
MTAGETGEANRSFLLVLATIAGSALAVRVAYALAIAPPIGGIDDDAFFHRSALELADGNGYVSTFNIFIFGEKTPTAAHPPLYPLALSVPARLGARSLDAQRMLGVLAGSLTVVAVGLMARRVADRRAGFIAAGLCAVYPAFVAADGAIMSESLFGCLVAFALLQALVLLARPTLPGAALLGLLVGLAALTRSEGLLLLPLLAIPVLVAAPAHRLRLLATMTAVAAVAISPWVIRNWQAYDQFLYSTNEGNTIAGANCDQTYYGPGIGAFSFPCIAAVPQPKTANEAVRSKLLRDTGLDYARDHLGRAFLVGAVRLARLWGFYSPAEQFHLTGRDVNVQRAGIYVYYAVLVAAAVGAAVLLRRGAGPALAVLLVPILLASVTAILTYGLVRVRHIAEVGLLVLAGVALAHVPLRPPR